MPFRELNIVLADDRPIFRTGVKTILTQTSEVKNLSEASSLDELEFLLDSDLPDVLILGLSIQPDNKIELIQMLTSKYPTVSVIAICMVCDINFTSRVLQAGGVAYLRRDSSPTELIEAVSAAKNRRVFLSSDASLALVKQLQNRVRSVSPHVHLSDREYQILLMICRGFPLVKIGELFGISVKTVSTYRSRILKKMNMETNAQLIQYAVQHKLFESISA